MLTPELRQRFNELRELPRTPTEDEELAAIVREIEDSEAGALSRATTSMHYESERLEADNRRLQALVQRNRALAERLEKAVAEANAERKTIARGLAEVLGNGSSTILG